MVWYDHFSFEELTIEGRAFMTLAGGSEDKYNTAKANLAASIDTYNRSLADAEIERLGEIYNFVKDIKEDVQAIRGYVATEQKGYLRFFQFHSSLGKAKFLLEESLLKWMNLPPDYATKQYHRCKYDDCIAQKTPGTCEWLRTNTDFQNWVDVGGKPLLWVRGESGCGKSYVTAQAVKEIEVTPNISSQISKNYTIFFFCSKTMLSDSERSFLGVVKSLLFQLWSATKNDAKLFNTWKEATETVTSDNVDIIKTLAAMSFKIYEISGISTRIVIDALDESTEPETLTRQILLLVQKMKSAGKALISSRYPHSFIDAIVNESASDVCPIHLDGSLNRTDIGYHVRDMLKQARKNHKFQGDDVFIDKIAQKLEAKADGMYILIVLTNDNLILGFYGHPCKFKGLSMTTVNGNSKPILTRKLRDSLPILIIYI
jgi:hypothetical protein